MKFKKPITTLNKDDLKYTLDHTLGIIKKANKEGKIYQEPTPGKADSKPGAKPAKKSGKAKSKPGAKKVKKRAVEKARETHIRERRSTGMGRANANATRSNSRYKYRIGQRVKLTTGHDDLEHVIKARKLDPRKKPIYEITYLSGWWAENQLKPIKTKSVNKHKK